MSTKLNKAVSRETGKAYRVDGGSTRNLIVTLQPGDVIEFRPKGLRGAPVRLSLEGIYWQAVRAAAAANLRG
jgi:hypothetical protein